MKPYKVIGTTALAAILITGPSTCAFAAEKKHLRSTYKPFMCFHPNLLNKHKLLMQFDE
ncbi:hypothetical protein LW858_30760 (plasmid) [Bacillus cereus]|nr:hypothetical protein [Bacillus cereus]UIJ69578.1 hypothetical protein LW858_30760 [Bacillus cereus]